MAANDPWFREYLPEFVRYVGLVLAVILVLAPVLTDVAITDVASGYPIAMALIFGPDLYYKLRGPGGGGGG